MKSIALLPTQPCSIGAPVAPPLAGQGYAGDEAVDPIVATQPVWGPRPGSLLLRRRAHDTAAGGV